ncbi:hypothetical protein GALL_279030 [mine drainage metagenome]|uniref:Uncharacterized protein n=1 Tax=mine drainage metagenome TaxID=410659 RepID=A0A1J5R2Q6_9ZZZZ
MARWADHARPEAGNIRNPSPAVNTLYQPPNELTGCIVPRRAAASAALAARSMLAGYRPTSHFNGWPVLYQPPNELTGCIVPRRAAASAALAARSMLAGYRLNSAWIAGFAWGAFAVLAGLAGPYSPVFASSPRVRWKRLPRPGSDSAHTLPPARAASRRQTASPTPLPA